MKKIFRSISTLAVLVVMACLVINPQKYSAHALNGIKLWAFSVLPSLFPFLFFTLFLTKTNTLTSVCNKFNILTRKIMRTSGVSAYVFFISILSGYPVGARLISELYSSGIISKDEATRTSTFCSTSGPSFVIGAVGGGMFNNVNVGYVIFLCHIISAVICGKIFCKYGDFEDNYMLNKKTANTDNVLYECVYSSVISILCVGGFICVFYVISEILIELNLLYIPTITLEKLFSFSPDYKLLSRGFICGLIECTNGCNILSKSITPLSASLACSLISFGGISIIFQSLVYLNQAQINVKIFLISKILQTIISLSLCLLCFYFINVF